MHPDRRAIPAGRQRRLPDIAGAGAIDLPLERDEALAGFGVIDSKIAAAKEVGPAGRRAVRRIDRLQGAEKPGKLARQADPIGDRCNERGLAVEPAIDRPAQRKAFGGLSDGQRRRDRHRQVRREPRQPGQLLVGLRGIAWGVGQAHLHGIAEVEGAVVPAVGGHPPDRQIGPVRELAGDQTAHQRLVDGDAIVHCSSPMLVGTRRCTCSRYCLRFNGLLSERRRTGGAPVTGR